MMKNVTACLLLLTTLSTVVPAQDADEPCAATALLQLEASKLAAQDDLLEGLAACANFYDPAARATCRQDARVAYADELQLAQDQFDARLSLCGLLGGGRYDPVIDPADFSTVIDNPFLPYPVGASWTYESETEEGTETIQVTVLPDTREIMGVECVTVRDVVSLGGVPVEDTLDWYAQDAQGNVWYFGEVSLSYDEEGYVETIDGTWIAGVEGAKPGIVMLANPTPGTTYRQEWWLGEAEDAATVLDDDVTVNLGLGSFSGCVQTADFLPPEPDALEHKFFAPGIGFVFETKPGTTETVELVAYSGI